MNGDVAVVAVGRASRETCSRRWASRIFKNLASRVGLGDANLLSGHSLRVGKAQDLFDDNVSLPEVMRAGGWSSPVMPVKYAEQLQEGRGAAAIVRAKQARSLLGPGALSRRTKQGDIAGE